jgi:L-fuculose-phosphate aldolase
VDPRERLAAACRILQHEGHEHFYLGHASAREAPGSDRFWVKPTGMGLEEVEPDDLVLLDLDGRRISGTRPLHHEMPIHAEIYRARPDVNAVVHTHPFYAAAFAAAAADFLFVSEDSVVFADGFGRYDSAQLVVSSEQGRALAVALGRHGLVLLRNHGIAAVGGTIDSSVFLALSFDRSLRLQMAAAALGPVRQIDAEEVVAMQAYFEASYAGRVEVTFDYLRRRALAAERPVASGPPVTWPSPGRADR